MKKLILVYGVESVFLKKAIDKIIEMSGNSEYIETEVVFEFDKEKNDKAALIFTSYSKNDSHEDCNTLIQWMRSNKHAYCMSAIEHPMGLNNYNNLNAMIMPMNFKFNPLTFSNIKPAELVEHLR